MKELVIFDMDGLMIDTEAVHDWSWKKTFEHFNIDVNESTRHTLLGLGGASYVKRIKEILNDDDSYNVIREYQRNLYHTRIDEFGIEIKPGVIDLLNSLKNKGVKLAVATSTRTESATKHLKDINIYHFFEFFAFGDMVTVSKPNPALHNMVIDYFNIDKSKALVLEDSYHGVKAANNANIEVIWIKDIADISDKTDIYMLNSFNSLIEAYETIISLV